jgi:hypothetical protein
VLVLSFVESDPQHLGWFEGRNVLGAPFLRSFIFNGALRFRATRCAHVTNVHETVCDRTAFFWLHRLLTAGTLNDGRFAHMTLCGHFRFRLTDEERKKSQHRSVAQETRLIGVV